MTERFDLVGRLKRVNYTATVTALFFLYVALTRTHGIADTFRFVADQVRDWRIVVGAWHDLPLVGPASLAGGHSLGPVYYWFGWLTDLVIGPFTDHLPHAGGYGTALLQAAADTWLFVALRQRMPAALALATALFIATAPLDVAVSASLWNPPVATAFIKMAMALALTTTSSPSLWRVAAITTLGWFAVQAHTTSIMVIGPLFAALVAQPLIERRWYRVVQTAGVIVGVVAALQIPYVIHALKNTGPSIAPTKALDTLTTISSDLIRGGLARTIGRVARGLQAVGFGVSRPAVVLAVVIIVSMLVVVARWRRQPILLALSVAPFWCAVALFLPWRNRHMYSYWFETIMPSMFLGVALAIAAVPWVRVLRTAGYVALVIVLALLPLRFQASKADFEGEQFRMGWYRPLIAGVRTVARHTKAIHDIQPAFVVDVNADVWFLYQLLGGHEQKDDDVIAVIQPTGDVIYKKAR